MEPASLVLSVVALATECSKLLEKYRTFRGHDKAAKVATLRIDACVKRLKEWKEDLEVVGNSLRNAQHPRLDNPEALEHAQALLDELKDSFAKLESDADNFRVPKRTKTEELLGVHDADVGQCASKTGTAVFRRRATVKVQGIWKATWWTFGGEKKVRAHVDGIEVLLDLLYQAVPLRNGALTTSVTSTDFTHLIQDAICKQRSEKQRAVDEWLHMPQFVQDYQTFTNRRVSGTCDWILNHQTYLQWRSTDKSNTKEVRILWINGNAGHGKSFLVATILADFDAQGSSTLGYSFSRELISAGGKLPDMPKLWLAQLLRSAEDALDFVYEEARTSKNPSASDHDVWVLLRIVASHCQPCLVLDGLDEYGMNDRDDLIESLSTCLAGTSAKVLIASRRETDIELAMNRIGTQPNFCISDLPLKDLTHSDLKSVAAEFVSKRLGSESLQFQQEVVKILCQKSDGMFQWIHQFDRSRYLRAGQTQQQIRKILETVPRELDSLYEHHWQEIKRANDRDRNNTIVILRWVCYAARTLTLAELIWAVHFSTQDDCDTPETISLEYAKANVSWLCGSMLEIPEHAHAELSQQAVHFSHVTVKDFLMRQTLFDASDDTRQVGHGSICHRHMMNDCLNVLASLGSDDRCCGQAQNPFLAYADGHWFEHVSKADLDTDGQVDVVIDFLSAENECFKVWADKWEDKRLSRYSQGCRPEKSRGSPLYYACLFNLLQIAQVIQERSPELMHVVGGEYGTPLQAACVRRSGSVWKNLLARGTDPMAVGGVFGTALHASASMGEVECLRQLIMHATQCDSFTALAKKVGASSNESSLIKQVVDRVAPCLCEQQEPFRKQKVRSFTPLHCASYHGQVSTAKLLIDLQANVNVRDAAGATPLVVAAARGHLDIVELLIASNADLYAATDRLHDGLTPLNAACRYGQVEVIELLLKAKPDLKRPNSNNWRPLDYAAYRNQVKVVELLLDHGAPINADDDGTDQALWHASYGGSLQAAEALLKRGARPHGEFSYVSQSALHSAAEHDEVAVISLLLQHGLSVNLLRSTDHRLALHEAAWHGKLNSVKLLCKHGSLLNAQDRIGYTPLHLALIRGHEEVAKHLLSHDFDVDLPDHFGSTPLHIAYSTGRPIIVQLLLQRNCKVDTRTKLEYQTPRTCREDSQFCKDRSRDIDDVLAGRLAGWKSCGGLSELMFQTFMQVLVGNANEKKRDIFEWLKRSGADFNVRDYIRQTALHRACESYGSHEDVELLISNGADPNLGDKDEDKPIFLLATWGRRTAATAELLLREMQPSMAYTEQATPFGVSMNPYVLLPGKWHSITSSTDGSLVESDLLIDTPNKDDPALKRQQAWFFALDADDQKGKFRMVGEAAPGNGRMWWCALYEGQGWFMQGTMTFQTTAERDSRSVSSFESHLRQQAVVIEGKWGTGRNTVMGTFRLEKLYDAAAQQVDQGK